MKHIISLRGKKRVYLAGRRALAALLALITAVCLLPASTTLAADEKAIQLCTFEFEGESLVYFGTYTENGIDYNVPWRADSGGFLFSEYLLGNSYFYDPSGTQTNGYYKDSTLKNTMDDLYNGPNTLFTAEERNAIYSVYLYSDVRDGGGVGETNLFPLSYTEATDKIENNLSACIAKQITDKNGNGRMWWLRSSYDENSANYVGSLGHYNTDSAFGGANVNEEYGVRPAFNIHQGLVLITSPAEGGKRGTLGTLGAISNNTTNEWKLTLNDSAGHGAFGVSTTAVSTTAAGGDVSIDYFGAKEGTNEYLSATIETYIDNDVLYYGQLKNIATTADASGTQSITIPALPAGRYTLKIFNEQCNGDYKTDYSSTFKEVRLDVTSVPAVGDPGIQLGTPGIAALGADDTVYFGKYTSGSTDYDVPWRALDTNGFLLSKYLLGDAVFSRGGSCYYGGSALVDKMNELYNGSNTLFTEPEQGP